MVLFCSSKVFANVITLSSNVLITTQHNTAQHLRSGLIGSDSVRFKNSGSDQVASKTLYRYTIVVQRSYTHGNYWKATSTIGRRAFSVGGPSVWNSLLVELRELTVSCGDFRRTLKTILFARYQCTQRNRGDLHEIALYKSNIDIDIDIDIDIKIKCEDIKYISLHLTQPYFCRNRVFSPLYPHQVQYFIFQ